MTLPGHDRYDYVPITRRTDFTWPGGKRLAVYFGINLRHFAFGEGIGAKLAPGGPEPDVLNYAWRAYGNRERQSDMDEAEETAMIAEATRVLDEAEGALPSGWLSPWIAESRVTPDLLTEAGYRYTLNWCMDDQPVWMRTRAGRLLSIPYPPPRRRRPADDQAAGFSRGCDVRCLQRAETGRTAPGAPEGEGS